MKMSNINRRTAMTGAAVAAAGAILPTLPAEGATGELAALIKAHRKADQLYLTALDHAWELRQNLPVSSVVLVAAERERELADEAETRAAFRVLSYRCKTDVEWQMRATYVLENRDTGPASLLRNLIFSGDEDAVTALLFGQGGAA
jgi:hypothetical protein